MSGEMWDANYSQLKISHYQKITKTQTDSGSQLPRPMSIYTLYFRMSTNRAGMRLLFRGHIKWGVGLPEEGRPEIGKSLSAELKKTDFSGAVCLEDDAEAADSFMSAVLQSNYERSHFLPQQVSPQWAGAASKREGALRAHFAFLERKLQEPLGLFFLSFKWASEPRDRCSGIKKMPGNIKLAGMCTPPVWRCAEKTNLNIWLR